ncbi:putative mitochondrial protein [Tanacetum coccineum]
MNSVFKEFLRKFMLVLFDDILVYNKSLQEHVGHMEQVLAVIKKHSLFAILASAMQDWPIPQTIKKLRGFLGLTIYYRRFIKNYAIISQPLTALLKKTFQWNEDAQKSFAVLKQAMLQAPALALLDFQKTFVVKTDASGKGIAAALQQDGHP